MRSPTAPPAAALAALALALAGAPAHADDTARAGGAENPASPAAPAAAAPPVYTLAPPPYVVPPGPYGGPYAAQPPYGWARSPLLVEGHSNTAMRNAGIVFFALGVGTTLVGIVFLAGSVVNTQDCGEILPIADRASPAHRGLRGGIGVAREGLSLCETGPAPGAASIGIGALLGVIGVPLFVLGNKSVLVPAPAPSVEVGLGTADLRWRF
jgi:hypothetical protein